MPAHRYRDLGVCGAVIQEPFPFKINQSLEKTDIIYLSGDLIGLIGLEKVLAGTFFYRYRVFAVNQCLPGCIGSLWQVESPPS